MPHMVNIQFSVDWSSGRELVLAESEPGRGLEFKVSPDRKPILHQYVGMVRESVSEHYRNEATKAVEDFLRRYP